MVRPEDMHIRGMMEDTKQIGLGGCEVPEWPGEVQYTEVLIINQGACLERFRQ